MKVVLNIYLYGKLMSKQRDMLPRKYVECEDSAKTYKYCKSWNFLITKGNKSLTVVSFIIRFTCCLRL